MLNVWTEEGINEYSLAAGGDEQERNASHCIMAGKEGGESKGGDGRMVWWAGEKPPSRLKTMGMREKGGVEEMTRTDWQQGQEKGVWRLCLGMRQRYQKTKSPTENKVLYRCQFIKFSWIWGSQHHHILTEFLFSPPLFCPVIAGVLLVSGCSITFQVAPLSGFSQIPTQLGPLQLPVVASSVSTSKTTTYTSRVALRSTQIPYLTLFLILHFVFFVCFWDKISHSQDCSKT